MPPRTPDGRYIVVRGRLWRATNPHLPEDERQRLTLELMDARRAVEMARANADPEAEAEDVAHRAVDAAKQALGERGPGWWTNGAPDLNRKMARNTVYADWFASLDSWRETASPPFIRSSVHPFIRSSVHMNM